MYEGYLKPSILVTPKQMFGISPPSISRSLQSLLPGPAINHLASAEVAGTTKVVSTEVQDTGALSTDTTGTESFSARVGTKGSAVCQFSGYYISYLGGQHQNTRRRLSKMLALKQMSPRQEPNDSGARNRDMCLGSSLEWCSFLPVRGG